MEHHLLSNFQRALDQTTTNPPPNYTATALSLITNPFTSDQTLSSLLETLIPNLQNPKFNHHHHQILSLLAALTKRHRRFLHHVSAAAHDFIHLPSVHAPSVPHALSLLHDQFHDESLFLSLCYGHCVKTRQWAVKNVGEFRLRPAVLITVLLGITKDPYPFVREAALDGLVLLSNCVVVEDRSLIEGCYFRATELLFDAENSVRCSAVRAVSEWGQFLVALSTEQNKKVWSDTLFVQLCLMTRDMDMKIRVSAFDALGKIQMVSDDILLQTFSKKALESTKLKIYPGHYTDKLLMIPGSAAAFTFVHGLQDEFHEVRGSACRALQMLTLLSAEFAAEAAHILMDILNDDSVIVRLQALETLYFITSCDHLKVEESHVHMFFGALIDGSTLIRSAARKAIQLTKLQKLEMFKLCINGLMKNLEQYPQDEADIFSALYKIGRTHGKFVTKIIREVFHELEPSFDGKLVFHDVRTPALLVLAISSPVSLERDICPIPSETYSYAVTQLGRISRGLVDQMDRNTLLSYLSRCSRLTAVSASEFFKGVQNFQSNDTDKMSCGLFNKSMELKKEMNLDDTASRCAEIIFEKVVDLWPLIDFGCMDEVNRTFRSWKEELKKFTHDSQPFDVISFTSNYLRAIKLLFKAWSVYLSLKNRQSNGMVILESILGKTERRLKEMLYRYINLSMEEELYLLELILVTYTLRLYTEDESCNTHKLNLLFSRVEYHCKEGSVELSSFVTELKNICREIGNSQDGGIFDVSSLLQKPLDSFSLKKFILSSELKYIAADLDVHGKDFQNPLPFVPGLPFGIPLEIKLRNVPGDAKLWVTMNLTRKKLNPRFVFLDLSELGGCNDIRKFSFVAPFYGTPKVKCFSIMVSLAMECPSKVQHIKHCGGPKHELVRICEEKEVYLSMVR